MRYEVTLRPAAARALAALPREVQLRIGRAVDALENDPRPVGSVALVRYPVGTRRIRVGDYRIIYVVEERIVTVTIVRIGHRRDVYR